MTNTVLLKFPKIHLKRKLTHDFEGDGVTRALALGVGGKTGEITGGVSGDSLQHQAMVAQDHSPGHVVVQFLTLEQRLCHRR